MSLTSPGRHTISGAPFAPACRGCACRPISPSFALVTSRSGSSRRYDLWEAMPERREAFDAWAAFLRNLVSPAPAGGKVITLKPTRRRARA